MPQKISDMNFRYDCENSTQKLHFLIIIFKINCPGYLTVSRYTFWDNFFFDEISIIQVILRYMGHPQFTSSQIGPLFNPILYDISNNQSFGKKTKMHGFQMFRTMNFVHTNIIYQVPQYKTFGELKFEKYCLFVRFQRRLLILTTPLK